MKTRAAVLRESPGAWSVEEVELDDPRDGEVLVEMVATGLCHSDHHLVTGDLPPLHLPVVGGHEGAGIVRRTGPGVTGLNEGDAVAMSNPTTQQNSAASQQPGGAMKALGK